MGLISGIKNLFSNILLLLAMHLPHNKQRIFFHRARGVKIGRTKVILHGVHMDTLAPELITIGDGVMIANNAKLLTHDSSFYCTKPGEKIKYSKIVIKDNAFIGAGAILLPGVTVGKRSIVAAGSVVTKDVKEGTLVAGNPAKVIRKEI